MKNLKLRKKIVSVFQNQNPEKIILFGSWARGEEDPYSDIDLIVILKTDKRFLDRLAVLYEMWTLPFKVDILAYTPEEFKEMLLEENPLLMQAIDKGEVIYEKSAA